MTVDSSQTLLVVDDDEILRERLARALRERGFEVHTAAGHAEAMAFARAEPPELAVVDMRMPGKSGLELIRDLVALEAGVRALVLTGYGSIATAVDAVRLGAVGYLPKPADADDIVDAFLRAEEPPLIGPVSDHDTPSLARAEWEHINRVLQDTGGNISETARRLGLHRRSLQRKLQKYPPKT